MKKILFLVIIIVLCTAVMPNFYYAAEVDLINNVQISLKNAENPARLEISFDLAEPLHLSQGESNIVYEYFTNDNSEVAAYRKDKSWSGYLNSYADYPSGEQKYSSGAENAAYPDDVPAATIYTSVKTNSSMDVTMIAAVRVTVLRADGSGERVVVYSDGSISDIEKIEIQIVEEDQSTGIRLESTTKELPANTILIAKKITSGPVYEKMATVLAGTKNFIAFDVKLESGEKEIQPNGKVKINIPIPEKFNSSNIAVYRINDDGTKTYYSLTITTKENEKYATFETDHFSIYVLAEMVTEEAEKETEKISPKETPKTKNNTEASKKESEELSSEIETPSRESSEEGISSSEIEASEKEREEILPNEIKILEEEEKITEKENPKNKMAPIVYIIIFIIVIAVIGIIIFFNRKKIGMHFSKK